MNICNTWFIIKAVLRKMKKISKQVKLVNNQKVEKSLE